MNTANEGGYSTPRDVFLYLLGLITLIASAISFGIVVYQFIDLKFPDVLQYGTPSANYSSIRSALATLVVVFPVFFWVSRMLHKDVLANPAKREMKIRRWLLYFTVFVAGLTVIIDLVALIRSYLNGDLTTAFVLKVITIFFIAGSILFYYLSELRNRAYPRKVFQSVIIGVAVLSIIYGFYVAGSPQNQRLVRLDEQKVLDLQNIQSRILYYWQQKGSLPPSLASLNDPLSGFVVPKDPQTSADYGYQPAGAHAFQLCANFNQPSQNSDIPATSPDQNWQHGSGQACFDRNIDQSLYPVRTSSPPIK